VAVKTAPTVSARAQPTAGKRFGYVVAIGCNGVALYIARHLLEWGWPRFLTEQFDDVLPLITVSFVYGMVTNAFLVLYDRQWFKSSVNVGGSVIAFVVTLRLLQVYPFDFAGYATNWSWLVTILLILGMVGTAIAAVAEAVRVVTSLERGR
jgi:hypothetical protein